MPDVLTPTVTPTTMRNKANAIVLSHKQENEELSKRFHEHQVQCTHCGSSHHTKNGSFQGVQRYKCKDCGRAFSDKVRKFNYSDKEKCLELYLNNTGIRKCAAVIGCSPSLIIAWIREFAGNLRRRQKANKGKLSQEDVEQTLKEMETLGPHIIEMDEIYAQLGNKNNWMTVWVSFSRTIGKVVAFSVGHSIKNTFDLYYKTVDAVGEIATIYTDGNYCYDDCFYNVGVRDKHIVAKGKSQTYRIEGVNSSIRDNLARFNRKSKRYSRKLDMLEDTLLLFFYYKRYKCSA